MFISQKKHDEEIKAYVDKNLKLSCEIFNLKKENARLRKIVFQNNYDLEYLVKRLNSMRDEGMSLRNMQDEIGVSRYTLSHIIKRDANPSNDTIGRIRNYFIEKDKNK